MDENKLNEDIFNEVASDEVNSDAESGAVEAESADDFYTEASFEEADDNAGEYSSDEEPAADERNSAKDECVSSVDADDVLNSFSTVAAPTSSKTTAVLITIVIVLVAVAAVMAVLLLRQLKDKNIIDFGKPDTGSIITVAPADNSGSNDAVNVTDVESEPEFDVITTLGQYKGLTAEYHLAEVTDVDVAEEISYFLNDLAEEIEVTDRPVKDGDIVNIDFVGYMNDEPFEGGTADGFDLEIGSHSFIDGFESSLIGHEIGEVVDVIVSFPDPYPNNPDYAGLPAKFVVTVNSITEYVVPSLTDEIVAENTEFDTAKEYTDYVREMLESDARDAADNEAEIAIMETAIINSSFGGEIDKAIDYYAEQYLAYYDSMAQAYYGIDGATMFLYMYGMDEATYHEYVKDNVEFSVKYQYLLDEIARVEALAVTEDEYNEEFESYFYDYYGFTDKEEVLEAFTENYGANAQSVIDKQVNESVLRNKAEQLILDSAIINK